MIPKASSIKDAMQVTLVDLHIRRDLPPQTKYNGGQRIAYTSVILMGFGSLVTGLAIYKPTQTHWVTTLLGGYEMARWEHCLADDRVLWVLSGACGAGDAGGVEQFPVDGERVRAEACRRGVA